MPAGNLPDLHIPDRASAGAAGPEAEPIRPVPRTITGERSVSLGGPAAGVHLWLMAGAHFPSASPRAILTRHLPSSPPPLLLLAELPWFLLSATAII